MKEIWRDKQAEVKAGKQTELCEFVFAYLHKRIGILSAVIEARARHTVDASWTCAVLLPMARQIWLTSGCPLVCRCDFVALSTAQQT